jgi:signal transduction histidine kinase
MRSPKPNWFRGRSTRGWSIRAKIISLLAVPLVTLVVMWGLATFVTLGPGLDLVRARTNLTAIAGPADALRSELQVERTRSVTYLAATKRDPAQLAAQRTRTDDAVAAFRTASAGATDASDLTGTRTSDLLLRLDGLTKLRTTVDRAEVDRLGALRQYTDLIQSVDLVYESVLVSPDPELTEQAHAVVSLARARELMAQEDALVSGALAAGTLSATELGQTIQLIGSQRYVLSLVGPDLESDQREAFARLLGGDAVARLTSLENAVVGNAKAGPPPPVDGTAWTRAYTDVTGQLRAFEGDAANALVARSSPAAVVIFTRIGVAGLLGLITVIITILATVRIGRSVIKRLAGLRQAALEMSIDRLPRVVRRLRQGEIVDVAHEAPPLPYGDDEIGQVGRAFNELQRTAVNAAVDEANVRQGLNEVFLNIARRSQTLLHRQLSILDKMERRTDDPTELEDLFRVDHLATRMRRHAEDLVILAGASPGRGWRNPVPLVDVLRGAVSEVEDYARVAVRPLPDVAIAGRAVADVIHLLAELIENATSFSPPHTKVNIGGDVVSRGFAVEIEDRGLGLTPDALALANARLTDPPDFDPSHSAQLGLFVVARLAARHGVVVQLRPSPYGGITAVALLPEDLVVPRSAMVALPPGPTREVPVQPTASRGTTYEGATYRATTTYEVDEATIEEPEEDVVSHARPYAGNGRVSDAGPVVAQAVVGQPMVVSPEPEVSTLPERVKPRHARREVIEAPASAGPDGLPRRVRQSSLAPQLRDTPPENTVSDNASTRSPEQLRAMMSAFQSGMNRGRRDAEDGDGDGNDSNAERDAL